MADERTDRPSISGDWRAGAACRRTTVDFFDEEQTALALAICRGCAVLSTCREVSLEERPPDGVWGGLTPRDRRVLALRRRQAAAAPRRGDRQSV